jgi:hypothetical protein
MLALFFSRSLVFTVILGATLGQAQVTQAQQGPLEAICQGFLTSSGAPAPGNANTLCSCLVREVQAGLSGVEMQAYQSATERGQALPQAVETKITAIAVKCLSQAQ